MLREINKMSVCSAADIIITHWFDEDADHYSIVVEHSWASLSVVRSVLCGRSRVQSPNNRSSEAIKNIAVEHFFVS